MDPLPYPADWAQRLREARRRELTRGASSAPAGPTEDDHRVSLTVVHDSVLATLAKIDAAEDAMRSVLRAWYQDPARGGAHLLVPEREGVTRAHEDEAPTSGTAATVTHGAAFEYPADAQTTATHGPSDDLPDTVRLPTDGSAGPESPSDWIAGPSTTLS
jgi:hypothetical protein